MIAFDFCQNSLMGWKNSWKFGIWEFVKPCDEQQLIVEEISLLNCNQTTFETYWMRKIGCFWNFLADFEVWPWQVFWIFSSYATCSLHYQQIQLVKMYFQPWKICVEYCQTSFETFMCPIAELTWVILEFFLFWNCKLQNGPKKLGLNHHLKSVHF